MATKRGRSIKKRRVKKFMLSKILLKAVNVLLVLTFITTQAFAGPITKSYPMDKLAPSSPFDPDINPNRSSRVDAEIISLAAPGIIGQGRPLVDLVKRHSLTSKIKLDGVREKKLREAIETAIQLGRDAVSSGAVIKEDLKNARETAISLIALKDHLSVKVVLFNGLVSGPEDYLLEYNMRGLLGLSVELVDRLYDYDPRLLAQYIYHGAIPGNSRNGRLESAVFGEDYVTILNDHVSGFINEKLDLPFRESEVTKRGRVNRLMGRLERWNALTHPSGNAVNQPEAVSSVREGILARSSSSGAHNKDAISVDMERDATLIYHKITYDAAKPLIQRAGHEVSKAFHETRVFEVNSLASKSASSDDRVANFVNDEWASAREMREKEGVLPAEQEAAITDIRNAISLVKEAVQKGQIADQERSRFLRETRFAFVLEPSLLNTEEVEYLTRTLGYPPQAHYYYGLGAPGIYNDKDGSSVIAISGTYPYTDAKGRDAANPRTIYISVSYLKTLAQLIKEGEDKKVVLNNIAAYLQRHSARLLTTEEKISPVVELEEKVKAVHQRMLDEHKKKIEDRERHRATEVFVNVDLSKALGPVSQLPLTLVTESEAVLDEAKEKGLIKDHFVTRIGDHLLFDVSHNNGPLNEKVRELVEDAIYTALARTTAEGGYKPVTLRGNELRDLLNWHDGEVRYSKRPSQPTLRQVIVGGAEKSSDGIIFDLYASPNITTQQAVEGTHGTYFVVQNTEDRRKGLGFSLPGGITGKDIFHCLAILKTAVNSVKAVFMGKTSRFPVDEPAVQAISLGDMQLVFYHSQAGAEAVGGITGPGTSPRIIEGTNGRRLSLKPVTLEEAVSLTPQRLQGELAGYAPTVIWGSQVFDDTKEYTGQFDEITDAVKESAEFSVNIGALDHVRKEYAKLLVDQGASQPALTTEEANRRALDTFEEFNRRVNKRSKEVESKEGRLTGSIFKADIGSALGHTKPLAVFNVVARAILEQAKRDGLIRDYLVKRVSTDRELGDEKDKGKVIEFRVGDDIELQIIHDRPIGDKEIHGLAWRAFWAAGWVVADVLKRTPYGLLQDLPNAKDLDAFEEAKISVDDFKLILAGLRWLSEENSRAVDAKELKRLESAFYKEYNEQASGTRKSKRKSDKVLFEFTGNVKGSGIGSAEGYIDAGDWTVFAFDKASPGAFSIPYIKAAEQALKEGAYTNLLFEIEKVRPDYDEAGREIPNAPIILDFADQNDRKLIETMLGAVNEFQVKAIRTKRADGTIELVATNSTDRLYQVTAGVYAGKDDPAAIVSTKFAQYITRWMRDNLFITEGDERGSHWAFVIPTAMDKSSPGTHSIPTVVAVSFTVTPDGEIRNLVDVFEGKEYDAIRAKAADFNWFFIRTIGNIGPRGDASSVEYTYPLWKYIKMILGKNSPYKLTLPLLEERLARISSRSSSSGSFTHQGVNVVKEGISVTVSDMKAGMNSNALDFKDKLLRVLEEAKMSDKTILLAIDTDIGSPYQSSRIVPMWRAIDDIKELKDADGKQLFPNLRLLKGSGSELAGKIIALKNSGEVKLGKTFIVAKANNVNAKVFDGVKDELGAWIAAIDDSSASRGPDEFSYIPVFESAIITMMASLNVDRDAIERLYNSIADRPLTPDALEDLLKNRIIYILPKITRFDSKELLELYRAARTIYVAA